MEDDPIIHYKKMVLRVLLVAAAFPIVFGILLPLDLTHRIISIGIGCFFYVIFWYASIKLFG